MLNGVINKVMKLKDDVRKFLQYETDYLKLSLAEKGVKIITLLVFGVMAMIFSWIILFLCSLALAEAFRLFLPLWAAYLCTAGAFLILLLLLFLLRKPLLMNPLSKALTKALFRKKENSFTEINS